MNSEKKEDPEELDNLLFLKPREVFHIRGPVVYREALRAWSTIHLKKEILQIFPQLRERRTKFRYTMLYNRSTKELKKMLEKLEKSEVVPILLLFERSREK